MSFEPVKTTTVHHSRLLIIKSLLEGYDGSIPFHLYLKSCFQKHKNFGSRDRKTYSAWCFAFFRLGKALAERELNERLAVAWYLVHGADPSGVADEIFRLLNEGRFKQSGNSTLSERIQQIAAIYPDFKLTDVFPFTGNLSGNLDLNEYAQSMFIQPRVWIRIAEGKDTMVIDDLEANGVAFERDGEYPLTFSLQPGVKLDTLVSRQKNYFEIQDRSSQRAGGSIPAQPGEHWWDCCCGAGGKSLQLFDTVQGIKITATDSRASILKNFRERTSQYHNQLSTTVLDLEQPVKESFFGSKFDGIVADVPCTGSGTWSRTPEYLSYFNEEDVAAYVTRQQSIISNAVKFLKSQGKLVYITCSVFRSENEEMSAWIASLPGMKQDTAQFINGSTGFADSMYCAVFIRD